MKKRLFDRVSDISKTKHRAAFADVDHHIQKHQGSEDFLELAQARYSCRSFSNRPVAATKVQKIVEAGRIAPSARDQQPVHVWVLSSEEALTRLRAIHPCYGAPVVFMVGYKTAEAWVRPCDGKNSAETDAAIAGTHMMLAATDMELESVWIGAFDPAKLQEAFPETDGYEIAFLLPVGHASAQAEVSELHARRQAVEDFATEL